MTVCAESQVIPFAVKMGNVSASDIRRVACCHILGAVSCLNCVSQEVWLHYDCILTRFSLVQSCNVFCLQMIESYLDTLLMLCQDTVTDVRQAICEQLPIFFKRLPEPLAMKCVEELLELLTDEEIVVRQTAVHSFRAVRRLEHNFQRCLCVVQCFFDRGGLCQRVL